MNAPRNEPSRVRDWRFRESHAIQATDGSCSAIYDIERTLIIRVPQRLRRRAALALRNLFKPDESLTDWLVEEGLQTYEPCERGVGREHPTLPTVTDVSLDVAGACNMACTYCFERQIPSRMQAMSRNTLDASVRFAFEKNKAAPQITFHFGSGEPLVGFDLIKTVVEDSQQLANSSGKQVKFELTTNGSLVTEDVARFLRDNRFTVRVSCDGPPHIHDRFRPMSGGRKSYHLVERGLALLLEHMKDQVTVNSVICGETRLRDLWHWAKQLGVRHFHVIKVGADGSSGLGLRHPDIHAFSRDTANVCNELYAELLKDRVPIDYQPISKVLWRLMIPRPVNRFCGVGSTYLGIASNGKIYPCFRHLGLAAYELGDVWYGVDDMKRMQFLKQVAAHVDSRPGCHRCWARYLCGGGCYADSVCYTPDHSSPMTAHCQFWRLEIEAAIRLFLRLTTHAPESLLRFFDCHSRDFGSVQVGSVSVQTQDCG